MNVVLAHPGTQHSFRLARELNGMHQLHKFVTSLALSEHSFWTKWLPDILDRRIARGIEPKKLKSYPTLFFKENFLKKLGYRDENIFFHRNLDFQKRIIENDIKGADVVIGFDTSSWLIAEYCASYGKRFILDVSIGHALSKERIFASLRKMYPEWSDIAIPKSEYLISFEQKELSLADTIVAPSHFVKSTLIENGVAKNKIAINPFGTDMLSNFKKNEKKKGDPVNFLFLGAMTARKGLPLLLEAWRLMDTKNGTLLLAGYGTIPPTVSIPKGVEVLGPIKSEERLALFQKADVFVFPSYFEGFAQVLVEAARCGLPIIASVNSGAKDFISNGVNGFIIETGNVKALTNQMNYFLENPESINRMSESVRECASNFSWENYASRWFSILSSSI